MAKSNFIVRGGGDFSALYKEFNKAQKEVASFQTGISKSFKAVGAALVALGIGKLGKDFIMTAADTETLNVAMKSVGEASGYAADAIEQHKLAVMDMGIAEQEATQIMTRFMQAQLDIADASKLARVAQDAAVIAGMNSSDAAEQMTEAIAKQRPMLLSQFGMTASLTDINQKYADTLGITVASMTAAQKQQAMLNYILSEGDKITGTYEASMGTVGKQIGSLTRYWQTFKNAVATPLLPILAEMIGLVTQSLINATTWFKNHTATLTKWANTIAAIIALFRKMPATTNAQTSAAKSNTAAIVQQGEAITDTGKAANKAALGIDEFHSISQNSGGGVETDMGVGAAVSDGLTVPEIDTSGVAEATEIFNGLYNVFVKIKAVLDVVASAFVALGKWLASNISVVKGFTVAVAALFAAWQVAKLFTFIELSGGVIAVLNAMKAGFVSLIAAKVADRLATTQLTIMYAVDFVKSVVAGTAALISQGIQWAISTALKVADTVATVALTVATTTWNIVAGVATAVTTALGVAFAFLTSPIGLVILAIAAVIAIGVLLVKNWDWVRGKAVETWENIKEVFSVVGTWFKTNVSEPIANSFKAAINIIIGAINRFISGINQIRITIPDWAAKLAGMSAGASIGFNIPTITPLATGGIVTQPTLAMIGEAGPEAVIPLNKGQKYLSGGNEQDATFNITVELDGDVIYNKMQRIKNDRGVDFGMGVFAR